MMPLRATPPLRYAAMPPLICRHARQRYAAYAATPLAIFRHAATRMLRDIRYRDTAAV